MNFGHTALTLAAERGNLGVVRALLAVGADVDQTGPLRQTSLMLACYAGWSAVARVLLDAGADHGLRGNGPFPTALLLAVARDNPAAVRVLIEFGADLDAAMEGGWTPLMLACWRNHGADPAEIVTLLVSGGAYLDARNSLGRTALMVAADAGDAAAIQALANAGASSCAVDRRGWAAIDFAVAAEAKAALWRAC